MRFFTKGPNVSMYNLESKNIVNFQILFATPFCNQKLYFRVFAFHNFMHKFLTKKPKQPTILFFIEPEKKENDAKEKSFTNPHLILYKTGKKQKRKRR